MGTYHTAITASRVGATASPESQQFRICARCGCRRNVNKRQPKDKAYMCGDCKSVDRAMAVRIGAL
jgi:hypothetical protein